MKLDSNLNVDAPSIPVVKFNMKVISFLRSLADKIEDGKAVLENFHSDTEVVADELSLSRIITIVYSE